MGVEAEALVLEADPTEQILDVASKKAYDLIAIGHRGRFAPTTFSLGRTATKVLHQAPCSILLHRD